MPTHCPCTNTEYQRCLSRFHNFLWHYALLKHFSPTLYYARHLLCCMLLTQRIKYFCSSDTEPTNQSLLPLYPLHLMCVCANTWVYLVRNTVSRYCRQLSRGNVLQFNTFFVVLSTAGTADGGFSL